MNLTRDQLEKLGACLRGTCQTIGAAIESCDLDEVDVDESDLEDQLLNVDTERCVDCDWWFEVCELEWSDAAGGGKCEQCR